MKEKIKLSAINPVIIDNIPHRKETAIKGKEYISYGEGNKYPTYLWNLYNTVATLGSIINGTVDFICGDKITILNDSQIVNKANDTIEQLVRKIAFDKMIFGGYAIEVIRNFDGSINEINHIDFMKLRCDANNENIYYSNDWNA